MSISKQLIILVLGAWIALVPFLGFPGSWKTGFIVVSALAIVVLSFLMLAKERLERSHHEFFEQSKNPDMTQNDDHANESARTVITDEPSALHETQEQEENRT